MFARISSMFFGMVCGAGIVYAAMNYYVLRTPKGVEFVARSKLSLDDAYLDIRTFSFSDWQKHTELAQDLVKANKQELMVNAAGNAIENAVAPLFEGKK